MAGGAASTPLAFRLAWCQDGQWCLRSSVLAGWPGHSTGCSGHERPGPARPRLAADGCARASSGRWVEPEAWHHDRSLDDSK